MPAFPRRASRPVLVVAPPRPWAVGPIAWWSLRCLLGFHARLLDMRLAREPDGTLTEPHTIEWHCPRCDRHLGSTRLAALADR